MKTKRLMTGVMLGMALTISLAYAEKVGNGGVSVVCRDASGQIRSAELLDIFEGHDLPNLNLKYIETGLDPEIQIQLAELRMAANPDFLNQFKQEVAKVKAHMQVIKSGDGLEPTNDAFPVVHKKGCKFEQLANYYSDSVIYVDPEIFGALTDLNRAALYVHEAIYAMARKNLGDTSSIRSRKLTAYLFASVEDTAVIQALMTEMVARPKPEQEPAIPQIKSGTYSDFEGAYAPIHIEQTKNVLRTYAKTSTGAIKHGYFEWNQAMEAFVQHANSVHKFCKIYKLNDFTVKQICRITEYTWSDVTYGR